MIGHINDQGHYVHGQDEPMGHDVSSQYKTWSHDNQRKIFHGDIVQPYIDGQPNPDFVGVYRGEVAERYFNQEQIDKADRNLGGI